MTRFNINDHILYTSTGRAHESTVSCSVKSARAEDVRLHKVGREHSRLGQPLWRVVDELLPLVRRRGEAVGGGAALINEEVGKVPMSKARWFRLRTTGSPEAPLSARACMLQAAPSSGQPRPISRLARAGRPYRACFRHGKVLRDGHGGAGVRDGLLQLAGGRLG